ncbi:MAG: EpsG family protein [Bacteroidota bacterium]|nr:EpsG family protein [Bacteroidota bacterium]
MPVYSTSYSLPYLVLLTYFVLLMFMEFRCLKFEQDTKYVRWATMAGFVFFFGLRGFVNTDWLVYYNIFNGLPTLWGGNLGSAFTTDFTSEFVTDASTDQAGIEMGFIFLTVLFKSIIPDYFAWVFVNVVIDVILLDIFFRRYSKYYVLSFILFLIFGGLGIEFNLMRNVKAILLFLISLKYIEERKIVPYMLLNIAGCTLHTSALFFIPLYFFLNKEWPKWVIWTIFIVGNILVLLQISYLKPIVLAITDMMGGRMAVKARLYFASDLYSRSVGVGLSYFERTATFVLSVWLLPKLKERNPSIVMFVNSYILFFFAYFFFSEIMIAIQRITLLFAFSYWIIYPEILGLLEKSINKLVMVSVVVVYSVVILIKTNSNIFAKYDNQVFGIESYDDRKQVVSTELESVLEQK